MNCTYTTLRTMMMVFVSATTPSTWQEADLLPAVQVLVESRLTRVARRAWTTFVVLVAGMARPCSPSRALWREFHLVIARSDRRERGCQVVDMEQLAVVKALKLCGVLLVKSVMRVMVSRRESVDEGVMKESVMKRATCGSWCKRVT